MIPIRFPHSRNCAPLWALLLFALLPAVPQSWGQSASAPADPLMIYGDMTRKTVLHGPVRRLPDTVLSRMISERTKATDILNEELAKQGLKLVADGDRFVQILPESDGQKPRTSALFPGTNNATAANETIDLPSIDLNTFLGVFEGVSGRIILRPTNLPPVTVSLHSTTPLTHDELMHAFCVVLSLNSFDAAPEGDKSIRITYRAAPKK